MYLEGGNTDKWLGLDLLEQKTIYKHPKTKATRTEEIRFGAHPTGISILQPLPCHLDYQTRRIPVL